MITRPHQYHTPHTTLSFLPEARNHAFVEEGRENDGSLLGHPSSPRLDSYGLHQTASKGN